MRNASEGTLPLPRRRRFGETMRREAWWIQPLLVFVGLGGFVVYATFRVLEGTDYFFAGTSANGQHANYLSPFYSPLVFDTPPERGGPVEGSEHAWMASKPAWLPGFVTAAALILIFPAGFRFTCYYYRGAYYKAFWADPPSCAVGEPRSGYRGEHSFPLVMQNIHRYFMYFAVLFIFILGWDAWQAMWFRNPDGTWSFGVGVGTLVLTLNVILLAGYTFGCHSLRHVVGGFLDEVSRHPLRKRCYDCVSCLNRKHMAWAWTSLIWVAFSDYYIRMCSLGAWTDWRLF